MAHEIILGNKSYLVSDRLTQDKAASQFRVLEDHAETTARAWGKACAKAHPEGIEISPRWHPAIQDEILRTGRWKETPYASEEKTWRQQWKIGWAIAKITPDGFEPLRMGLIQTKKSDKKLNVLSSDDNFRRGKEIGVAFIDLVTDPPEGKFVAFCIERKSFPRNASSAAKVAYCWGVLCLLSVVTGVPVVQASPQEVKTKMCGKANASKAEVQAACVAIFGDKIYKLVEGIAKSNLEHPFDGLATMVACSDSEVLRLARMMMADR